MPSTPTAPPAAPRPAASEVPDAERPSLGELFSQVSTDLSQAALYDVIVAFMTWRTEMEDMLGLLRPKMAPACKLWILWPAADPRVAGDLTDQAIREVASSGGLAATGARPIDQTWSAMRLTIRRPASAGG